MLEQDLSGINHWIIYSHRFNYRPNTGHNIGNYMLYVLSAAVALNAPLGE